MLSLENAVGAITTPDVKVYCRAAITKAAWYWHKRGHISQRNRTENTDLSQQNWSHLILLSKMPKISIREKIASLADDAGKTEHLHIEEWTRSLSLTCTTSATDLV